MNIDHCLIDWIEFLILINFNILRITVYTTTMSAAIPGEYNTLVRPQVMKNI